MNNNDSNVSFDDLGLDPRILKALKDVGYETPSPIQANTIPLVMEGHDLVGQAQTGTGKTAAFALPLLNKIDIKQKGVQALVLAPTRELAIQVAEAFQTYAKHLKGFHVLPIYGGSEYGSQLRALKRGVHVVVGTPGRVMDHMRRGTLSLDNLSCLVLDEADEMLRMGFIDDVEWILEQSPDDRQIALFSATMPNEIRKIAKKHLHEPQQITIKSKTSTVEAINQRYWLVGGSHKLDALTRILESENFDAVIIFVRTRLLTIELAEKLQARGYAATALNGDIQQRQRERCIQQLKTGKLDILIATDVAARGLDVERISHVINYDIPTETEAYVHRIGRTGRAGRTGEAILFVTPRERHWLSRIEKATKQKIALMELPSTKVINDIRIERFKQKITNALDEQDLNFYQGLIEEYEQEHNVPAVEIAAALARLAQGDEPLLLKDEPKKNKREKNSNRERKSEQDKPKKRRPSRNPEFPMDMYRIEVGKDHGAEAKNIVGAIANEAGLNSQDIGKVEIHESYTTVELPEGMPKHIYNDLKKAWVANRQLNISLISDDSENKPSRKRKPSSKKKPSRNSTKPRKRPNNAPANKKKKAGRKRSR